MKTVLKLESRTENTADEKVNLLIILAQWYRLRLIVGKIK